MPDDTGRLFIRSGTFTPRPQTANLSQKSTFSMGTERQIDFGRTTESLLLKIEDSDRF